MHKYIKVLPSIVLALTLSACVSTSPKHQQPKLPLTELTVLANRLAQDSRPIPKADDDFSDQRFIIVVPEYEHSLLRQYITVYGEVSGERSLVNGPKTRVIPVITAIETMEWNSVTLDEQVILAKSNVDRRRARFNSFNRFDNRGFSRFGRLNRFGRQSLIALVEQGLAALADLNSEVAFTQVAALAEVGIKLIIKQDYSREVT